MRRSIFLPLLALTLAAFAAGGCAEDRLTKAQYQRELDKIKQAFDKQGEIFCDPGALTAEDFESAATTLEGAADDLEDVTPPENIEQSHEQLVTSLRETADLFGNDIKDAFLAIQADPTDTAAMETLTSLQNNETLNAMDDLQADYERAGYTLDQPEETCPGQEPAPPGQGAAPPTG